MPWFPDFASAGELARRDVHADALADPVRQYLRALNEGTIHDLEAAWAGQVIVHDPHAGTVRGHRHLRKFVDDNRAWQAARQARTETVASTCDSGRAAVELLAYLSADGAELVWPVAVVAEFDDELSIEFRTYCSQRPLDGRRHERAAFLPAGPALDGIAGRYRAALAAGDADGITGLFAPDGYYREPFGVERTHTGTDQLRAFFATVFAAGGVGVEPCVRTDDGVRCAVEYNYVTRGNHTEAAQAGLAVLERAGDGRLAAVRVYDDVDLADPVR